MSQPPVRRRRTPSPRRPRAGFIVASTLLLWLATGFAAAALWPSYGSMQLVVMVAVTTIVGSAIAILGAVFRWSSLLVMTSAIGAFLVLGVPLAVPSSAIAYVLPSLDGLRQLLEASALGWKQLLTISLPVGSYQTLLVPAFMVVLVVVVISLTIALRAKFGELGVLGPIALFIFAILFGPEFAQWPIQLSIGLTASVLLWLIWRRWYRRRESIRMLSVRATDSNGTPLETVADGGFVGLRTLISAGLIMAIAAIASIGATTLLPPTKDRVVLRSSIVQPFDPRDYPSPLSGFRKYEQPATADRTILTVLDLPRNARIRIATLDTYDGIVYSVGAPGAESPSGSFTRVPLAVDQSGVKGERATMTVTIGDYAGVWLPTVGDLVNVNFRGQDASTLLGGFYFNENSATGAVVGGLKAGDRYTLTTVLPTEPSQSEIASLRPASNDLPPIGVVPDGLSARLEEYVKGINGPGQRLVAMLAGLRADGYISHGVGPEEEPSRSGHAADRITQLLTDQRMIGDQEQYATTAALMARQLGFPARVVFGFAPGQGSTQVAGQSSGQNSNQAETIVRGSDVSAWIEVDTTDGGWVTIDPTPAVRPIPDAVPEEALKVARPQAPVQPNIPNVDTPDAQLPPNTVQEQPPADNPVLTIVLRVLMALGWSVLVIAVLLSPFLTIVVAKLRRRRLRRRAPTAIQRIAGGWDEFEDAALDHGFTPGPSPTRIEVAQVVGGVQPLVLAAVADRAVFSPGDPDDEQADQLWRSVDELRYSLDADRTTWERIKSLVSLRSLGGYSVKSLFKR